MPQRSLHHLAAVKKRFDELDYIMPPFVVGVTEAGVANLQAQYDYPFPAALKEALLWLGNSNAYDTFSLAWPIHQKDDLRAFAIELFEENGMTSADLPDDAIIFHEHEGYNFTYLRALEGDDPPVYFYSETQPIKQIHTSFSDYLLYHVELNSKYARTIYDFTSQSRPQTAPSYRIESIYFGNGRPIVELPETLFSYLNTQKLSVRFVDLQRVSARIGEMQQLTVLSFGHNRLHALPPTIGNLKQLTSLSLDSNRFITLPPEIGRLRKLTHLSASDNQLVNLPRSFQALTQLTHVNLDRNRLTTIDMRIFGRWRQLEYLDLSHNPISSIPAAFEHMPKLNKLLMINCPISAEDQAALRRWFPNAHLRFTSYDHPAQYTRS